MPTTLGSYLDPRQVQMPTAPAQGNELGAALGAPQAEPTGFRKMLQSPEMMAFLMQAATSMLAQQGIGQSIAQGAGAMGRSATSRAQAEADAAETAREQAEADRQFGLEERKVAAYEQSIARAGRGGGGGSSSKTNKPLYSVKDYQKMLFKQAKDEWDAKANSLTGEDPGPPPSEMDFIDEAERLAAARSNGMPLDIYSDLRRGHGRQISDQLLNDWATNPEQARQDLEAAMSPPPATPMVEAPELPQVPQIPTPGADPKAAPKAPRGGGGGGGSARLLEEELSLMERINLHR